MIDNTKDRWKEFNLIVDDENLTHDEKVLLLIIFRFVNNKSKLSYPCIETLKKKYGTKRNETIYNKLKSLYKKGYLIKKQGYKNRNEYTIVFPNNELCTKNGSSIEKPNEVLPKNRCKVLPINGKQKDNENKINKNINKQQGFDNIINCYTKNQELKIALFSFIKMRKANKKAMTDVSVQLLLKMLNKLGKDDNTKIEILNQSILNSWTSIYGLNQDYNEEGSFNYGSQRNDSRCENGTLFTRCKF